MRSDVCDGREGRGGEGWCQIGVRGEGRHGVRCGK